MKLHHRKHFISISCTVFAVASILLSSCAKPVVNQTSIATIIQDSTTIVQESSSYISYDMSIEICIDCQGDLKYHELDAEERVRYGLPSEVKDVVITEEDVGEYFGTVTSVKNADKDFIGSKVYHYSKYPKNKAILIVEVGNSYVFVCTYGYIISVPDWGTANDVFSQYGLPQNGTKLEVYDIDGELIRTITDIETIEAVIDLIKNCTNIGIYEKNRRLVQAWKDTYGNEYVSLDEETGEILYQSIPLQSETSAETDVSASGGVETGSEEPMLPLEDMAFELWKTGALNLVIEVEDGYRIYILYSPISCTFSLFNGSFDMTIEQVHELESILNV